MIVQHRPPLHLTYCLNIHPGESWAENFEAIKRHTLGVKACTAPNDWFGLGLRLSAYAAQELLMPGARDEALDFFAANQLYPFTINGFPYGTFHQDRVKENVYAPDWRTSERRNYTIQLADVLASVLPENIEGSISTVPGSFKSWIMTQDERTAMAHNLAACVAYLAALRDDTGRLIHLGLEPEPACFLETTAEAISFFKDVLFTEGAAEVARMLSCDQSRAEQLVRTHLGICFDTCHVALQFEDLTDSMRMYQAEGIKISKVQISAALKAKASPEAWEALTPFAEGTYLHQVKARTTSGEKLAWLDLPEALEELPSMGDVEEARVHFHVPLFFQGTGALQSTSDALTPEFFHLLREGVCSHLEIETYTFDVLPPEVHPGDIVKSVAREYSGVISKLGGM
jgi:sugar phosphate isomerase/epimerase